MFPAPRFRAGPGEVPMFSPTRFFATLMLALFGAALPLYAALDSTLFTNYKLNPGGKTIEWVVCGSLPGTSGCYGSGSLGPLARSALCWKALPVSISPKAP